MWPLRLRAAQSLAHGGWTRTTGRHSIRRRTNRRARIRSLGRLLPGAAAPAAQAAGAIHLYAARCSVPWETRLNAAQFCLLLLIDRFQLLVDYVARETIDGDVEPITLFTFYHELRQIRCGWRVTA